MRPTIVYGAETGCIQMLARQIACQLRGTLLALGQAGPADLDNCPLLILGCPAGRDPEQYQDWQRCLAVLDVLPLEGKTVALFGTGGDRGNPAAFLDALGILHDIMTRRGARLVGFSDTDSYGLPENASPAGAATSSSGISLWLKQLLQ